MGKSFASLRTNPPLLEQCQKAQAAQFKAVLRMERLEIEDLGQVLEELNNVGFTQEILDDLKQIVVQKTSVVPSEVHESKWQNYEAIRHYIPEDVWEHMRTGAGELLTLLGQRGYRTPTEPTMQTVTALLLCQSEGFAKASSLALASNNEYLK